MLIGLCGPAMCGKDSICRAIGWERMAFADELKSVCDEMLLGIGLNIYACSRHKEIARPILVEVGRAARKVDPQHWIASVSYRTRRLIKDGFDVCFTDVRYANEVAFIHEQGGTVFRVHRPGYGPANTEEAESLAEISRLYPKLPEIHNDGTIEAAAQQVRKYLEAK
jgi:hypothetical protein